MQPSLKQIEDAPKHTLVYKSHNFNSSFLQAQPQLIMPWMSLFQRKLNINLSVKRADLNLVVYEIPGIWYSVPE